jgi:hypothetical protein
MIPPSAIDLTNVAAVKTWLSGTGVPPNNTSDDDSIQACITYFSAVFIWRTANGPQDNSFPDVSPFNEVVVADEVYDGSGSSRLFLNRRPIQFVNSLVVQTQNWIESTSYSQTGFVIDGTGASIFLRGGLFPALPQCVFVGYGAGFNQTPSDIVLAATKSAALQYKRKDWIGLHSKALSQGAGTTSYETWELDPDVERLISNYTRWTP